MADIPVIDLDDTPENADWIKFNWGDLPPYKSEEFNQYLEQIGMSLDEFKKLPVYRYAVQRGLIKDDKWVGKQEKA